MRQFLIESLCLAFAGCALGCLLAYAGIKILRPLIPYNAFPQEAVIELNLPVLLFSLAMAVLSTVICGMTPAVHALRADLRSRMASSTRHNRSRSALAIAEVALSVILLVSAGLMMRTVFYVQRIDLGINPNNLLYAGLSFPLGIQQTPENQKLAFEKLLQKVKELPGVTAVGVTLVPPPPFGGFSSDTTIPGKVHSERWATALDLCSEGYFGAVQVQLQQGRLLAENDVSAVRRVTVVNRAFVEQYFGGENPIGRSIRFDVLDQVPELKNAYFEIIGVVSNTRNRGLKQPPMPQAYLPHTLIESGSKHLLIRTAVKPESLIPAIRRRVWDVDPNVALVDATSIESWLKKFTFANPQFEFITLGGFAAIGLLLVLIGIFSVMAYTVALRTHEIGVRMALGAARGNIIQMVLGKGLGLISFGIAIGVAGSLASTRIIAHHLQGVTALDPWTYAGVLALTIVAGLAACFAPARRAAKVDPLEAIRCD